MGRQRKRKEFVCKRCGEVFVATVCKSGMCKQCRVLPPGDPPLCACGCGEKTKWQYGKKGGWRKYVQGHHIRDPEIGNPRHKSDYDVWNKGNRAYEGICANPECGEEIRSSYEKKYCSRECANVMKLGFEPWHKGLKKGDHPGLDKLGESVSAARLVNPVHNKGKTKEDYEPLARAGESISVVLREKYECGELENWNKGLPRDDSRWNEACESISRTKTDQIASGELIPTWYKRVKRGWMLNVFTGENELFRSAYEASYMDILNSQRIRWTTEHDIVIRWVDSVGYFHRYVPDFQVWLSDDVFEIHEIKSVYMEQDADNQRKFQAAIRKGWREGWEFKVLTEETNPEFKDFDPQESEWFVDYDKKTKALLGMA